MVEATQPGGHSIAAPRQSELGTYIRSHEGWMKRTTARNGEATTVLSWLLYVTDAHLWPTEAAALLSRTAF